MEPPTEHGGLKEKKKFKLPPKDEWKEFQEDEKEYRKKVELQDFQRQSKRLFQYLQVLQEIFKVDAVMLHRDSEPIKSVGIDKRGSAASIEASLDSKVTLHVSLDASVCVHVVVGNVRDPLTFREFFKTVCSATITDGCGHFWT
jgi:hypothetical protein